MITDIVLPDAGAFLLEVAVKGSVLLLLAFLATCSLPKSSAAVRHWIWVTVFGALLALPLLAAGTPGWRLSVPLPAGQSDAELGVAEALPALLADATGAANAAPEVSYPFEEVPTLPVSLPLLVWAMGAAGVLLLLAGTHLRRALEVARAPRLYGRVPSILHAVCRMMGVAAPPRLVEGGAGSMPTTSGVLQPVIALPNGAADTWPEERLESVLLHELAHVRRRDLLVQLFAQVACALHWYNPLAWRALRQLRLESEMACDDLVLSCGVRASSYGELLIRLAREQRQPPLGALAWIPVAERSQLPARLRALLDESRRHGRASAGVIGGILIGAAALAGVVATASGAAPAPSPTGRYKPDAVARQGDHVAAANGSATLAAGRTARSSMGPAALQPAVEAGDTIPPALLNRGEVQEAIRRSYPANLRDQGVSGTALVELDVDASGTVTAVRLLEASDAAFAAAAPEALRIARFRPAHTESGPVGTSIRWPVAFNPYEVADNAYQGDAELVVYEAPRVEEQGLREVEGRAPFAWAEPSPGDREAMALSRELAAEQAELQRLRELSAAAGGGETLELRALVAEQEAVVRVLIERTKRVLDGRDEANQTYRLQEQQAEATRRQQYELESQRVAREEVRRAQLAEQQAQAANRQAREANRQEAAAVAQERQTAQRAAGVREARLQEQAGPGRSGQPGRIVGSVVDAGGTPVAGAEVTVRGAATGATTNRNGRFAIYDVAPGRHTLEVSVPGSGQKGSITLTLAPGESAAPQITVSEQ